MLSNFNWVREKLAAMGRPDANDQTFGEIREEGIKAIVSLTVRPLPEHLVSRYGFDYLHIPIRDFTAPTIEQITAFVDYVRRHTRENGAVLVHCGAGYGRTGTMLACYLVWEGKSADEALGEVARVRPGSVETDEQTEAVRRYADLIRRTKQKGSEAPKQ